MSFTHTENSPLSITTYALKFLQAPFSQIYIGPLTPCLPRPSPPPAAGSFRSRTSPNRPTDRTAAFLPFVPDFLPQLDQVNPCPPPVTQNERGQIHHARNIPRGLVTICFLDVPGEFGEACTLL